MHPDVTKRILVVTPGCTLVVTRYAAKSTMFQLSVCRFWEVLPNLSLISAAAAPNQDMSRPSAAIAQLYPNADLANLPELTTMTTTIVTSVSMFAPKAHFDLRSRGSLLRSENLAVCESGTRHVKQKCSRLSLQFHVALQFLNHCLNHLDLSSRGSLLGDGTWRSALVAP